MSQSHGNNNEFAVRDAAGGALSNTSLMAAPGVGSALYITDISLSNGATARTFQLLDGSGGTVVWQCAAPISGVVNVNFRTPIKLTSNTALCATNGGASAGAYIHVGGFVGRG